VIAESWAATVALQFAAERPARVEELVLISPIGFTSPLTGQRRMPNSFSDAVRRLYSGDVKDAGQALEVLGGGSIDIPALAPQYASSGEEVRQAADVLSGWLDKGAFELVGSQHPDNVRRVRQQVSLVWGRDDLWAGLDSAFYLTRRLRNVRLRVFPGTGHLLSVENPVPLGRHIRSVLGMPLTDPSMAT
jgi:pimeloyl-ACP methyl ester carboxylesterase